MHPNPIFRKATEAANLTFARGRAFGILAVNGPDAAAPMLSHVPFVLAEDGRSLLIHLVRSNPIAQAVGKPCRARIAVSGPDSYVSPDWYGIADQVPTWNYVAVHLSGTLERLPQDEMSVLLAAQSAVFENRLLPKPPWTLGKMPDDILSRLLRQIVPFRMAVETIDGTWKLGQNKTEAARLGAAEGIAADGIGQETAAIAEMMRNCASHDET